MSLHDYIDWDIDEEKQKNRKNAEKILRDFPDVKGLKEVLDDVLALMDSEIYEKVYRAGQKDPKEMTSYIDTADDLLKLRQVKLASEVLKDPPLYVASLTGVIIITHFQALFAFIGGIHYAYAQRRLSRTSTVKEHAILERLMALLDDFDKPISFQPPDEEFYKKLKDIKWDKQAKKLFGKIDRLRGQIATVRWGSTSSTFGTTENFALTFLAACNVVNQNRNKILNEDVIVAYRTYLKLLDTDITQLDV
ncbi:hypothetical protein [Methanobacterium sp. ACI-7]|uniref:hypothetical protein n=1 Tax=unclassified Methanobacterium TaxID=2627676 RepID=UPI0039C08B2F